MSTDYRKQFISDWISSVALYQNKMVALAGHHHHLHTSGLLPAQWLRRGAKREVQAYFLITFLQPRAAYLRLLELYQTNRPDPALMQFIAAVLLLSAWQGRLCYVRHSQLQQLNRKSARLRRSNHQSAASTRILASEVERDFWVQTGEDPNHSIPYRRAFGLDTLCMIDYAD